MIQPCSAPNADLTSLRLRYKRKSIIHLHPNNITRWSRREQSQNFAQQILIRAEETELICKKCKWDESKTERVEVSTD